MLIQKPRVPLQVEVDGKPRYRVGYAQMLALMLLDKVGKGEPPPEGILSATGILREHIFNDMIPLKYVSADVPESGHAKYFLTTLGRKVLEDGTYANPPRKARKEFGRLMSIIQSLRRPRSKPAAAAADTVAGRRVA